MKNLTCVWRNIYNTARATHSRYYKHFAKHACDFSLILLEPCNFLYRLFQFEPQLGSTLFLTLHEVLAFSCPVPGRVIYSQNLDFCGGDVSNSRGKLSIQVRF